MGCWQNSQSLLQRLLHSTFNGLLQLPSLQEYENPTSALETEGRDNSKGPMRREGFSWGPSCGTCSSETDGN